MFAYVGSSQRDLERLFASLRKAAKHDKNLVWYDDKRHADGWGCVVLSGKDLTYHRTVLPIYDKRNAFALPDIEGKDTYAIFHARRSTNKRTKGNPIFSHPFMEENERKVMFLAHNGWLKIRLPPNTVDSEIALRRTAEKGGLKEAMPGLQRMKYFGMNLLLLEIDRRSRKAGIKCFSKWKEGPGMDAFYQMYLKEMEGGRAVFSSTMNDDLSGKEFAQGKISKL